MRHQRILTFCLLVLVCCHGLRAQSLWNHRRPTRTLFADRTARDIGDILTIIIDEQQRVENDEETRLEKGSTLAGVLSNFDIFPKMFQTMPAIDGSIQRDFNSKGKYDKDNRFQTRVSVLVVDVLPNGNLVLEGTRRLLMDGETKVVRITGVCRALDVTRDNTIRSESIANAAISYEGDGFLSRNGKRGWFSRLLDLVWPF
ncbi:MAG: flagellar basal body L-ring protein FlgH [Pirellulaceae bacterium]|nr:flagellar basal body L-ring protein FlgH [Pirellulaceae bacterium]